MRKKRNDACRTVVNQVRGVAAQLAGLSNTELQNYVNDLRESIFSKSVVRESLIVPAISASNESIRRVLGIELYDVQILASYALISQQIAEMQTGEGKTISAVAPAVFGGILGRGAHVATPNAYLAKRDFEQLHEIYETLGLTVGLLTDGNDRRQAKIDAYACDVTYGPGFEFGFDYLRDQVLLKEQSNLPAGKRLLCVLDRTGLTHPVQRRGLGYSIVDEIDNVLIDDASSPQILSQFQEGEAPDKDAVLLAKSVAIGLDAQNHFRESPWGQIELTEDGKQAIHGPSVPIPVNQLVRPWSKYVEAALRAKNHFHRDVHYVVSDDQVRIVEQSTGRIFKDRSWQSGLHQAIEAKEGIQVTPESISLAQITRQRFYRLYDHLSGMTGTARGCTNEFKTIYALAVTEIPLRIPSQRRVLPVYAFDNESKKWDAIARSVCDISRNGQPVLIGTRTILESQIIANRLEEMGKSFALLNGKQDADEADIIAQAGQFNSVTIATNLAGRGTDIKLGAGVETLGGLHVIVSECHASTRVDRQLIGRCARQGNQGSCQTFVSADDWLFTTHASWFAESLKWISKNRSQNINLQTKIEKIQTAIEGKQFASRLQLFKTQEQQNKLLGNTAAV